MIRFAVFDLDGTLVDSRRDLADAANRLIRKLGGEPLSEQAVTSMVGEGAAVLVRRVLAAAGLDPESPGALAQFLDLYDERLLRHTRPYDGTEAMLAALSARMRLAVLTNKPQAHTERVLRGLGLSRFFQDVIGGDTPFGRKPDPGGLSELARRAGVPLAATALIGDSPIDLETARRAGSQAVLVSYGFGYRGDDLRDGEHVVSSPAELARLLWRPPNLFATQPSNAD
jgi:phosphoglycolate phosphatase